MSDALSAVMVKSLDHPDESRKPSERGRFDLVTIGDATCGRAVFRPGWRWSVDVKPVAGTELCEVPHTGTLDFSGAAWHVGAPAGEAAR